MDNGEEATAVISENTIRSPSTHEPPASASSSQTSGPRAPASTIDRTLTEINQKMGSMADLIGRLCYSLDEREMTRATGCDRSTSKNRRHRSPSSSSDSSVEALEDQLSVRASEDELDELIKATSSSATKSADKTKNGAKNVPDTDVLLTELEATLNEDDKQGPPINKKLAELTTKRWGKKLEQEQIKSLLAKLEVPENCAVLRIPRVNLEVWHELNTNRRSADLRLHNTQLSMLKAMSAVLYMCDKTLGDESVDKSSQKAILGYGVDAMALLSHAIADLSSLRREQMQLALKQEIHSLCTKELSQPNKFVTRRKPRVWVRRWSKIGKSQELQKAPWRLSATIQWAKTSIFFVQGPEDDGIDENISPITSQYP